MIYTTKNIFVTVLALCLFLPLVSHSQAIMEVEGSILIKNSGSSNPQEGTIRYNSSKNNFEGWNGSFWVSLTRDKGFGSVMDIAGNEYKAIKINDQIWMAENLRASQFNDGRGISNVANGWENVNFPARCSYDNNEDLVDARGYLYNWYAVDDGKLCPLNWHVPSQSEWTDLVNYLGGSDVAGKKMKLEGFEYWERFNSFFGTNESEFSGLPGGLRDKDGEFAGLTRSAFWWSASHFSPTPGVGTAVYRSLASFNDSVNLSVRRKNNALSVRCVKDSN